MRLLLTEFVGTFFLVLTIGLTAVGGTPMAPLAIGATLMVMVYMGGHVSGAHYNPAVTLAVFLRGKLPTRELAPYMASQILGAICSAVTVNLITGGTFAPTPAANAGMVPVLLVEILYTFALCLVVLNSATATATKNNSFYGLAIGFTVAAGALAGGPVSGGAFNPAVGIGPIVVDSLVSGGTLANLWYYVGGPLLGGVLAAVVFKIQNPTDAAA